MLTITSGVWKKEKNEFIDSLPQIIFETDTNGNITFVNQQFELDFGYTMEDIANGFNIGQAVAPEDLERALGHFRMTLIGTEKNSFEGRLVKKDGKMLYATVYPKVIVHDDTVTGTRGFIVNVTKQKQAEQSYRNLFESSVDGIVHVDMNGRIQKQMHPTSQCLVIRKKNSS